jgi:hypothetical protein
MQEAISERHHPLPVSYMVLFMVRIVFLGLTLLDTEELRSRKNKDFFGNIFTAVFTNNLFLFIFLSNAIMYKKILQFEMYLLLVMVKIIETLIVREAFYQYVVFHNAAICYNSAILVVYVVELVLSLYLISRYREDFNWTYFKKFGASGPLREAHKTREMSIALKKVAFLHLFRSMAFWKFKFKGPSRVYCYMAFIIGSFQAYSVLIMAYLDAKQENTMLRKTFIGNLAATLVLKTFIVVVVLPQRENHRKYAMASFFDFTSETFVIVVLIYLAIKDHRNFGIGLARCHRSYGPLGAG